MWSNQLAGGKFGPSITEVSDKSRQGVPAWKAVGSFRLDTQVITQSSRHLRPTHLAPSISSRPPCPLLFTQIHARSHTNVKKKREPRARRAASLVWLRRSGSVYRHRFALTKKKSTHNMRLTFFLSLIFETPFHVFCSLFKSNSRFLIALPRLIFNICVISLCGGLCNLFNSEIFN